MYIRYLDIIRQIEHGCGSYEFDYLELYFDKVIIDILCRTGYTIEIKMRKSTNYEFDRFFDYYDNVIKISKKN
jgi:hypothetical protein